MKKYRGIICRECFDFKTIFAIQALLISILIPSYMQARRVSNLAREYEKAKSIAVREFGSIEPPNDQLSELERKTWYQSIGVDMDPKEGRLDFSKLEKNIGKFEDYIHRPTTTQPSSQPSF
jgi:hypothetical protein